MPPAPTAMTWLGHATVLVEMAGIRVLTDPALRPRLAHLVRVGAGNAPGAPESVDVVLISHLHHDHCDLPSMRLLGRSTPVVVPVGAGRWLRRRGFPDVVELAVGASTRVGEVEIRAVPADHDGTRTPFGPRAESIGFVVSAPAGPSIYFAGDTGLHPAMADLAGVDAALIPVWGWGTNLGPGHLNPVTAAAAVELVDPAVVVPIHWGTFLPVGMLTLSRIGRTVLRDPPERFAQALAERGLGSRLVIATAGTPVAVPTAG